MASKYLDGSMVPRAAARHADHRAEPRVDARSQITLLRFRGRDHQVPLVNVSPSGAMLIFSLIPHIGERISVALEGRGRVAGRVCWVRGGKIGISFDAAVE